MSEITAWIRDRVPADTDVAHQFLRDEGLLCELRAVQRNQDGAVGPVAAVRGTGVEHPHLTLVIWPHQQERHRSILQDVLRYRYAPEEWMPDATPVMCRHGDSADSRILACFVQYCSCGVSFKCLSTHHQPFRAETAGNPVQVAPRGT